MRKLRVALVLLLLLAFITASVVACAKATISTGSIGDALSIAKSRATLQNIEKKLMTGTSDIARINQQMGDLVKIKAAQSIANVTSKPATNRTNTTIRPNSTSRLGVPMGGIGDAIQALGGINMKIRAPVEIAKGLDTPRLAVFK